VDVMERHRVWLSRRWEGWGKKKRGCSAA